MRLRSLSNVSKKPSIFLLCSPQQSEQSRPTQRPASVTSCPYQPPQRSSVWRHSDSHYGFRPSSLHYGHSGLHYHHHHHGFHHRIHPSSSHISLTRGANGRYIFQPGPASAGANLDDHYSAIPESSLPRYLWGPPPPYSQPGAALVGQANAPTTTQGVQTPHETTAVVSSPITSPQGLVTSQPSQSTENLEASARVVPRTTKSGLLMSSSCGDIASDSQDCKQGYDDSVMSANHIYQRANCNSLPSAKKPKEDLAKSLAKSVANLQDPSEKTDEEARLVREVRQKLNALGMYKYQHSKAARELAEIRDALRNLQSYNKPSTAARPSPVSPSRIPVQSLPLPPIPVYQPPSLSSCSTENKYETIGKSISPYKIDPGEIKKPSAVDKSPSNQEPIQKKSKCKSLVSSLMGGSKSKISSDDSAYGFSGAQSASPMSLQTTNSSSRDSPSSSSSENRKSDDVESSHYSQISPLRGCGLPPPGVLGTSNNNSNPTTPLKHSYFQVCFTQGETINFTRSGF